MTSPAALDVRALHDAALARVDRLVATIQPDQFSLPTPCEEWDVAALLGHLTEGNEMFSTAAGGALAGAGTDPLDLYARSANALRSAWEDPGALDRDANLPFGALPGFVALRMHFVELLLHGWDLTAALGDERVIDSTLATAAYEEVAANVDDEVRGDDGPFVAEVAWPADAPIHERLVAFLGRHPHWAGRP